MLEAQKQALAVHPPTKIWSSITGELPNFMHTDVNPGPRTSPRCRSSCSSLYLLGLRYSERVNAPLNSFFSFFFSSLSAAIFFVVTLIFLGTSFGSPSTICRSLRLNFRSPVQPLYRILLRDGVSPRYNLRDGVDAAGPVRSRALVELPFVELNPNPVSHVKTLLMTHHSAWGLDVLVLFLRASLPCSARCDPTLPHWNVTGGAVVKLEPPSTSNHWVGLLLR